MMAKLPEKHSLRWVVFLAVLFVCTVLSFFVLALLLGTPVGGENLGGFGLLGIIISLAITIGGYLGARIYFITALIFDGIATAYMLFIAANQTAEGWSDLVGVISYLFTLGIGLIIGILLQLFWHIRKNKKGVAK